MAELRKRRYRQTPAGMVGHSTSAAHTSAQIESVLSRLRSRAYRRSTQFTVY